MFWAIHKPKAKPASKQSQNQMQQTLYTILEMFAMPFWPQMQQNFEPYHNSPISSPLSIIWLNPHPTP